jgi:hypothetical protein
MWIVREANPFGRLSIRKLLLFVAAVCAASFAYIFIAAPTTHAADVVWNGETLTYDQQQYIKQEDAGANDSRGIAKGTHVYSFTEKKSSDPDTPQKIHFIFIDTKTDPTKATTASYATYDFTPPDTFKNPSDKKTISMTPRTDADTKTTSCAVEGIGWMVCPITNFFAGAMDWLFDMLSGFLAVRPVQTTQTNALYRGWSYMRNFANVAFVIAFMVIIYSQVSTFGISNYGIKKLLPRLIVAAILVNVSYWICAIAIDISNILGYSIQDIFISMRKGLVGGEGNSWNVTSWQSVTGFVLSGGTALTALGIGTYSALAGAGGAIYLLLPILLGVLMAVLVALLVLAARQAIITILVIISPLAFVAYILPNTEKYFKKWHELGMTLLVMFPAFSVVFGGSQLAGTAIIQNADSINLIILGMAVQVAPLAITPLLMRVSGSLLTKIGGLVNNPKRGMVDRTRNWANSRAEDHKARNLGRSDLRRRNFMARSAQAIDNRNRKREGWRKVNEAKGDNRWHDNEAFHAIDTASREADRTKQILERQHEADWNRRIRSDVRSMEQELKLRVAIDHESLEKAKVDVMHEEFKAGRAPIYGPQTSSMSRLLGDSENATRELALTGMRKQAAERKQKQDLTSDLLANTLQVEGQHLREYAGGVLGQVGAESVLTNAVASERDEYRTRVKEKTELINHFNVSASERQKLALGKNIEVEKDGVEYTFRKDDDFAREAAIDQQLKKGSFSEVQAIIAESGEKGEYLNKDTNKIEVREGTTYKYRTSIRDAVKDYSIDKKANFLGAQTIDDISLGKIAGEKGLNMAAARAIFTGKISDDDVSGMKAAALTRLFQVNEADVRRSEAYNDSKLTDSQRNDIITNFHKNQEALKHSAWQVVHTPMLLRNAEKEAADILKGNMAPPPPSP